MSDEPTDPLANRTSNPEPQDFDENALTSIGETQIDIPDAFADAVSFEQLVQDFLGSITPDDIALLEAGFNHQPPRPPAASTNNQALQGYLVQMEHLAGIPRQEIETMEPDPPSERGGPIMLFFEQTGCRIAHVPPVTFNGPLMPLFVTEHRPSQRSNDDDSDATTEQDSDSPGSTDGSESFEMPDAPDDIEVFMKDDTQEDGNQQN